MYHTYILRIFEDHSSYFVHLSYNMDDNNLVNIFSLVFFLEFPMRLGAMHLAQMESRFNEPTFHQSKVIVWQLSFLRTTKSFWALHYWEFVHYKHPYQNRSSKFIVYSKLVILDD